MKKFILILAVIPMVTLGQVYTYEDYYDLWKIEGELLDCRKDFSSVGKMDYIDDVTRDWADFLWDEATTSGHILNKGTNLIYVFTLINNVGDRIKVGSFVKKQIGFIIEDLEFEEEGITQALFLIDNKYLIACGDKLKGIIKKAIMKLKSLELRTE